MIGESSRHRLLLAMLALKQELVPEDQISAVLQD